MTKLTFAEQIKHPNWQRKRLEVMENANFQCENCGATEVTLNVHHKQYVKGRMYWEYERHELECLCEVCHKNEHDTRDGLKELLAGVDSGDAFALLAGFHHHSDWIERPAIDAGRTANPLAYAAGFVGWLTYHLEIDEMDRVAGFAASLLHKRAEPRLVYDFNSDAVFGRKGPTE